MSKYILVILVAILSLAPLGSLAANDVNLNGIVSFEFDTIDASPVLTTILGQNGGAVNSLIVGTDYIDVNLDAAGSDITFNTTGGLYFKVATPLPVAGVTLTPAVCITNQIRLQSTANATIRLQVTNVAPICGGGGGGSTTIIVPENISVKINNGAATSASANVNLTLIASNAQEVVISNDPNFVGAQWQSFTSPMTKPWNLGVGEGTKKVYVLFKSSSGTISNLIIASIEVKAGVIPEIPPEEPGTPAEQPQPLPGLSFNQLLKGSILDTVYYYGADGKRHAFPNPNTYFTWYSDFSGVKLISNEQLAMIPLGENVTYRPGVKMIKVESDPKVYAVDTHGILRWINSENVAVALYGNDWAKLVDDLNVSFFINYTMGADITGKQDYNPADVQALAIDINHDKDWVK